MPRKAEKRIEDSPLSGRILLVCGVLIGVIANTWFQSLTDTSTTAAAAKATSDRAAPAEATRSGEPHDWRLPDTLGDLTESWESWMPADAPDDPAGKALRLTTAEGGTPNAELSHPKNAPVGYGGLKYNETKLTRAIVALSGKSWPPWTLLHHRHFELDLDRLDRRLWRLEATLKLRVESLPFGQGDSSTGGTDIAFIVAR